MPPKRRYNTRKQKIQNSKSIQKMTEFIKLEIFISKQGLKINGKEYKANIQFDNNEIIVCDETKENADWFMEFLDDASVFKGSGNYTPRGVHPSLHPSVLYNIK